MKSILSGASLALALGAVLAVSPGTWAKEPVPTSEPRPIDLVICLDTSGSMQGLIDAARQKIWTIVNDLALAKPTPDLRVALLTFGNNGHDPENGWVHIDTGFTRDLDLVSEKLFALSTNGGEEYVGRVVAKSVSQLAWTSGDEALKLIVVAGNESADQDREVSFRDACRDAIGRGVMVNAIYCGDPTDDLAPDWREVASLSDGKFAAIDKDHGTVVITTPFDDDLAELSTAINATYVSYTPAGRAAQEKQWAQDENAEGLNSAAAASRAQTKGCETLYRCDAWDLVDACKDESFKLEEIEKEQLPEPMQELTLEEQRTYLAGKDAERQRIQTQIAELGKQREAFIAEAMRKQAIDGSRSIDFVLRQAIREQAGQRGFTFADAGAGAG